jgi:hypothetical protein
LSGTHPASHRTVSAQPDNARAGLAKAEIARQLQIGRTSVRRILKPKDTST